MKRLIAFAALMCAVVALVGITAAAKDNNTQTRLLTGQVTDRSEAPLPNAVVYLKNTKTLAVKTYVTDANGAYRFPELSPNVDYEVHAEFKGTKSDTKTLSSFDSRLRPTINLKVAATK